MSQPSSKPSWVPSDDATKIIEPSTSKKNTGWLAEEKPPYQYFNWFWNVFSKWVDWFQGCNPYNIVVSSDSDEQDYASLEAYIAAGATAGDRVIIKNDQTITAQITIPSDIEITMLKNVKCICASALASVIELSSNIKIKGNFLIEMSHTGTAAAVITYNGDDCHCDNIIVKNLSTGTITDAFLLNLGVTGNFTTGMTENSGGGIITDVLDDNSAETSNDIVIRET